MYIGSPVRRHIFRIPRDVVFTTRELLNYGKRNVVDKILSDLVKKGYLIRLARGVFIREGSIIPSIAKIASIKARAFGKEITSCSFSDHTLAIEGHIRHFGQFLRMEQKSIKRKRFQPYECINGANEEAVISQESSRSSSIVSANTNEGSRTTSEELVEITYLTTGCKSEFRSGNTIIKFKTACGRKEKLTDDSKAAKAAKKMWQIGKRSLTSKQINEILSGHSKQDRQLLQRIINWLPAWLSDKFITPMYIESPLYKYNYQQFYAVDPKTGFLIQETIIPYENKVTERMAARSRQKRERVKRSA